MEKPMTHHKKQFVPNAFKYMIAVSSIAGTLGVWNLLANKDLVNANAQNSINSQTTTTVDQASLPTLVPVIKIDLSSLQANGTVSTTVPTTGTNLLREVARPTAAPATSAAVTSLTIPSPSSNTSIDQSAPAVLPPAPVTTTQSSKP